MVRRDFITPPDIPVQTIARCLRIPASQEWLGVFNAALLFASEAWRYEQLHDTSLTPEDAASVAFGVYVDYLNGACGIMDVRQSPFDPCTLEKTFDGETWEPFAYLLLCAGELPAVAATMPPATGELQVTDGIVEWSADGETWTDMPTPGPLPPTAPVSAQPGDTTAKRCLAAANAANVLSQFYQQTFGAVAAGAANTLGTMNAFLQSVNHVLINLVFPYWQDSVLGAWLFEQQDFETNWAAPALTTEQQDNLRCLLFCYSSVDGDGVTRFDFQAIIDNAITDLGVNPGTAITGMLAYIQSPGLDAAGSTTAITSADCDECPCVEEWCYTFDSFASWTIATGTLVAGGDVQGVFVANNRRRVYNVSLPVTLAPGTVITEVSQTMLLGAGSTTYIMSTQATPGISLLGPAAGGPAGTRTHTATGETTSENVTIALYCDTGSTAREILLQSTTIRGRGTNPFGTDNC